MNQKHGGERGAKEGDLEARIFYKLRCKKGNQRLRKIQTASTNLRSSASKGIRSGREARSSDISSQMHRREKVKYYLVHVSSKSRQVFSALNEGA